MVLGHDMNDARGDCGPEGCTIDWLTSARFDVDGDPVAFQQLATDAGWGDGLPLIPPTEERVRAHVAASGRFPEDHLGDLPPRTLVREDGEHLWLSARTGAGMTALRDRLRALAGGEGGGSFSARARHLEALELALVHLAQAEGELSADNPELAAEQLRQAQGALGQITGHLDAEGLLGRIFSGFCIGK